MSTVRNTCNMIPNFRKIRKYRIFRQILFWIFVVILNSTIFVVLIDKFRQNEYAVDFNPSRVSDLSSKIQKIHMSNNFDYDLSKKTAELCLFMIVEPTNTCSRKSNKEETDCEELRKFVYSIFESNYGNHSVNFDVILVSGHCKLERCDIVEFFKQTRWIHGYLNILRSPFDEAFEDLLSVWKHVNRAKCTAVIIDAHRARPLPKNWYRLLLSMRHSFHQNSEIISYSVQSSKLLNKLLQQSENIQNGDVVFWELLDSAIFSPFNFEKFRSFVQWLQRQRGNWFLWPTVLGVQGKSDPKWKTFNSTKIAKWTAWFSRFSAIHRQFTVYPNFSLPSEFPFLQPISTSNFLKLKLDGILVNSKRHSRISNRNVQKLVQHSHDFNHVVSLTLVNENFLDTARSWICNVDVGGFRPPGIAWITTDDVSFNVLSEIPKSIALRFYEMKGAHGGNSFGSPGYWLLMLERAILVRDLLDNGVSVFLFETDQVWLRDPMPIVYHLLDSGGKVDLIGTLDAGKEIGGNFLFLNPSLEMRMVYNEVARRFESTYNARKVYNLPNGSFTFLSNDQSILSKLVLYDEPFRSQYPIVLRILDTEQFACGRWYKGQARHKDAYSSLKSRSPTIINNNWVTGVEAKTKRLALNGHWFWNNGECDALGVKKAMIENHKRGVAAGLYKQPFSMSYHEDVIDSYETEASFEDVADAWKKERRWT